jgi:hypothetical protein
MAGLKTAVKVGIGAAIFALTASFDVTIAFAQAASPAAPSTPTPGSTPASATTVAVCFQPPAAVSPDEVASFMTNPAALLSTYPTGGLPLATRARALAGSNISTVDALISLASTANADQRSAIGAGLARAARACVASNPEYAAQIQQKVAASNLSDVVTAFLAASNDVQTAALGAGGAGAGGGAGAAGGIGGGGATNGGSGDVAGDAAVGTNAENFSVSGGGQFFRSATTSQSGS